MDTDESQPSPATSSPGADPQSTSERAVTSQGDCAEAVAELFTFLDGALTDERRLLISAHLDHCAPCFSAYEFHMELRSVIQRRCQSELPVGLKERIFQQVRLQVADSDGSLGR